MTYAALDLDTCKRESWDTEDELKSWLDMHTDRLDRIAVERWDDDGLDTFVRPSVFLEGYPGFFAQLDREAAWVERLIEIRRGEA